MKQTRRGTHGMKMLLPILLVMVMTIALAPLALAAVDTVEVTVGNSTTTQYESVDAAISAINANTSGSAITLKLLADTSVTAGTDITRALTIDVNGHTLTVSGTSGDGLFMTSAVVIKDTAGNGKITRAGGVTVNVNNQANVTLQSGTIENTNGTAIQVQRDASAGTTVSIEGGTVSSGNGNAIFMQGTSSLEISGGTMEATGAAGTYQNHALQVSNYSTATITGGTVRAKSNGIQVWDYAHVEISGGTVTSTNRNAIQTSSTSSAEISSGTVSSSGGNAIQTSNTSSVEISGGTMIATGSAGSYNNSALVASNSSTVEITGGTFSANSDVIVTWDTTNARISSGHFKGTNTWSGIRADGSSTITINGGSVNAYDFAVKTLGSGTATIGEISFKSGKHSGTAAFSGNYTIADGSVVFGDLIDVTLPDGTTESGYTHIGPRYTITWDIDGTTTTTTLEPGDPITPPTVPEKSGYTFLGWYKSTDSFQTIVDLTGATATESVTYVAQYFTDRPVVGPGLTMANYAGGVAMTEVIIDGGYALRSNTTQNHTYSGILITPSGSGTLSFEYRLDETNTDNGLVDGDTSSHFDNAFNGDGCGDVSAGSLNDPTGWHTGTLNVTAGSSSYLVYIRVTNPVGNGILYLRNIRLTHDVKWDIDGSVATTTLEHGEAITPPTVPAISGKVFEGWYRSDDATQTVVDLTGATATENVTYVAKFTNLWNISVNLGTTGSTSPYPFISSDSEPLTGNAIPGQNTSPVSLYYYSGNYNKPNTNATMTITVEARVSGYLFFDTMVSGKRQNGMDDYLTYQVNGVEAGSVTAYGFYAWNGYWGTQSVAFSADESKTITITFTQGSYTSASDSDRAYISNIRFVSTEELYEAIYLPDGVTLSIEPGYAWVEENGELKSTNNDGLPAQGTDATIILTVPAGNKYLAFDLWQGANVVQSNFAPYKKENKLTAAGDEWTEIIPGNDCPNVYYELGNTDGYVTRVIEFSDTSHCNTVTVKYRRNAAASGTIHQAKIKNIQISNAPISAFSTDVEYFNPAFDDNNISVIDTFGDAKWYYDAEQQAISNGNHRGNEDGSASTSSIRFTVPEGTKVVRWEELFNRWGGTAQARAGDSECYLLGFVDGVQVFDDRENSSYSNGSTFQDNPDNTGVYVERLFEIEDSTTEHIVELRVVTKGNYGVYGGRNYVRQQTYWLKNITTQRLMMPNDAWLVNDGIKVAHLDDADYKYVFPAGTGNFALAFNPTYEEEVVHAQIVGAAEELEPDVVRLDENTSYQYSFLLGSGLNIPDALSVNVWTTRDGWIDSDVRTITLAADYTEQANVDLTGNSPIAFIDLMTGLSDYYWSTSDSYSTDDGVAYVSGNSGIGNSISWIKVTVTGTGTLAFDYWCEGYGWSRYGCVPVFSIDTYYPTSSGIATACGSTNGSNPNAMVIDKVLGASAYAYWQTSDWTDYTINISGKADDETTDIYIGFLNYSTAYHANNNNLMAIRNVRYVSGDITLTLESTNSTYGSVTATGDVTSSISMGANTVKAGEKITLTASANSGKQFYGWYNGEGQLLSTDATYSFFPNGDITVRAEFQEEGHYAAYRSESGFYTDLSDALNDGAGTVVLVKDLTLSGNVTVPSGVTLLIPFSASDTTGYALGTTATGTARESWTNAGRFLYETLTIPAGKTLTVNGSLILGAVQHYPDQSGQGHTSGAYSQIVNNGSIVLSSGSNTKIYGLVTGDGTATLKRGANGYVPFVTLDYAGGTNTENLYNSGEFPFRQFATNNVQCDFVIEGGSNLYGLTSLYFWSSVTTQTIDLVRTGSGLVYLPVGSTLTATYDPSGAYNGTSGNINLSEYGKTKLTIEGNATAGRFYIQGYGSQNKYLNLPYTYDLEIASGTFTVPSGYGYRVMPGSTLTVDAGAALAVNGQLIVPDAWEGLAKSGKAYPYTNKSGTLVVDGTMNINGTFGGVVQSIGSTGKIVTSGSAKLSGRYSTGSSGGYQNDYASFQLAGRYYNGEELKALEASKTYYAVGSDASSLSETMTFTKNDGSTIITSVNTTITGVWATGMTVSFNKNAEDATGAMDPQTIAFGQTQSLNEYEFDRDGYNFTGWNTVANPTEQEPGVAYADEDNFTANQTMGAAVTLYAQWEQAVNVADIFEEIEGTNTSVINVTITDAMAGTFTVTSGRACIVLVDNRDGTYRQLEASGSGNTRSYQQDDLDNQHIIVAIMGDANGDGKLTSKDATLVLKYLANKVPYNTLESLIADADGSGKMTSKDATRILKQIAGKQNIDW